MKPTSSSNDKALAAFTSNLAEASELLAKLTAHVEDHLGVDPDALHWGHTGDTERLVAALKDLAGSMGLR